MLSEGAEEYCGRKKQVASYDTRIPVYEYHTKRLVFFSRSILLLLRLAFNVSIALDEASCRKQEVLARDTRPH